MQDEHGMKHSREDGNRFQAIIIMVLFVSMIVLWGIWIGMDLSTKSDNLEAMFTAAPVPGAPQQGHGEQGEQEEQVPSLAEAANTAASVFLEESTTALIKDIMATIPGVQQKVKIETYHLHTRYDDLMVMGEYPGMAEAREAREAQEARWQANMGKNSEHPGDSLSDAEKANQRLNAKLENGFGLLRSGQPSKALSKFEAAAQTAPANLNAKVGMAQALYALNRSGEAQRILEKIVSARPNHPGSLLMLGALSQESGNNKNARKYYKSYLKHHPTGRRSDEIRRVLNRL